MKTSILLFVLFLALPVEAKLHAIDPESSASMPVDFDTRAVVMIKPAFDSMKRECTATQIDNKIFLIAGHCLSNMKKAVMIPNWRDSQFSFKAVEKLRQPTLGNPGSPEEEVDPQHDLGLVLIQPHNCDSFRLKERHVLPLSKSRDSTPADDNFQLAAFGSSGIKFQRMEKEDGVMTPKFGSTEYSETLQTVIGKIFDCASGSKDCKSILEWVESFKNVGTTVRTVAKRKIEISEMPMVREMTISRQGSMFMDGDSGAVMVQKDKNGDPMISAVLSGIGVGKIDRKEITIRREGERELEIEVEEADPSWVDPSRSALSFKSVKAVMKSRNLVKGTFEISRSYELSAVNFFSSLSDPINREFLDKGLEELRKKRDEQYGCKREPASTKKKSQTSKK